MRLKWNGDQTLIIPEVGMDPVEPGAIVEVDDALGKRLAQNPDWQVTSRKKGED
jgi:hypothetical protein